MVLFDLRYTHNTMHKAKQNIIPVFLVHQVVLIKKFGDSLCLGLSLVTVDNKTLHETYALSALHV